MNNKLDIIKKCKDPEFVTREKLINKYLTQFLNLLVDPELSSFDDLTLDTLIHPDDYVKNDE